MSGVHEVGLRDRCCLRIVLSSIAPFLVLSLSPGQMVVWDNLCMYKDQLVPR